jgi:type VI secretion system secreted protein VgrG
MRTLESNRFLYLTTPLGEDKMLLAGFTGQEGLNQLFQFDLDLLAENTTAVDFDKLIGQKVSFGIQGTDPRVVARDLHGIVTAFSQGTQDFDFTAFKMTIEPAIWMLTRQFRSRIFQHITIPDLLKNLFEGFDVAFELQGTFQPREYVTQYQETDFAFASRLMEEEGIFYFFKFTRGAHKLVLANTPQSHPDVPGSSKLIFDNAEGGVRDEERIFQWRKKQVWDSGKHTLWDHKFQLPHKHLDTSEVAKDSVQVGKVSHKLKLAGNDKLEVLEHPGRYAVRFDGIDKGGSPQPANLEKIFQDNKRTNDLRMQLIESGMLEMQSSSNCRQITAGHKFSLQQHFNGDGQYVITQVSHQAAEGSFRSEGGGSGGGGQDGSGQAGSDDGSNQYGNTFSAQPFELPYRPDRSTERPKICGPMTAVVVGAAGDEIFTDEYGRVKVKFMWDPASDSTDSSCWARVATSWAGQNWGSIHIPRIGQEVIVIFENGDPDYPLVIGSVYNPDQMPPYTLPDHKTVSTTKSRSSMHGTKDNYNELRFEDLMGSEQVFLQAERAMDQRVKADSREYVGGNRSLIVKGNQSESVGGNQSLMLTGNLQEEITQGDQSLVLDMGDTYLKNTLGNWILQCPLGTIAMTGTSISINGTAGLSLQVGGSCISMTPASISISSPMVLINSGPAVAIPAPPCVPDAPAAPDTADDGTKFDKM